MIENEFRVRPVTRYVLTYYRRSGALGSCHEIGEFANIQQAEGVGVALQALVPGATFVTLQGRDPGESAEALGLTVPPTVPPEGIDPLTRDELAEIAAFLDTHHDGDDFAPECPGCTAYRKVKAMLAALGPENP